MPLHQLKCLLHHITDIVIVSLGVVNAVAEVLVPVPEQVHDGEDLAIVGDEGLGYSIR